MTSRMRAATAFVLTMLVTGGCSTMGNSPATAPAGTFSAEVTAPRPGTRWVVKDSSHNTTSGRTEAATTTWTVLGEGTHAGKPVRFLWDGTAVHVHDRASHGWMALLDAESSALVSYEPHEGQLSSPLWVGKSWVSRSTMRNAIQGRTVYDLVVVWKVSAYEDVVVPAGRFKAFKLEAWPDKRGLLLERIAWYAPDVGLVVKEITEGFGAPYSIGVGADRIRTVGELVEHVPASAARDENDEYARLAARAVMNLGAGALDVESAISDMLKDADARTAARASGSAKADDDALKDIAEDVRAVAVAAVSVFASAAPEATSALIEAVRDPRTRLSTVALLARLGVPDEHAVPVLVEVSRTEPDTRIKAAVSHMLRQLAERGDSPELRGVAGRALRDLDAR